MSTLLLVLVLQSPVLERADAVALAAFAHERGEHARSRELLERALLAGPATPTLLLRAATCAAEEGDARAASSYLVAAAAAGLRDAEELRASAALAPLRSHPLWDELVARVERSAADYERSLREPELRRELLSRAERDQEARAHLEELPAVPGCSGAATASGAVPGHATDGEYTVVQLPLGAPAPECAGADLERVDRDNTAWLRGVVERHGWPGRSLVGDDGAQAAWLLVQHADLEPAFQRRCLELMRAAPAGEVGLDHVAYLTDRVALASGEPQVYGTQFRSDGAGSAPAPVVEPDKLDERRRAMGLCSMAVYAEHFRADHSRTEHGESR